MSIFKSNRDFDSTLIIVGIHTLMGVVLWLSHSGDGSESLSSFLNNLVIVYGMIASYFFKSQNQKESTGNNT